jgi:hypothetical protein
MKVYRSTERFIDLDGNERHIYQLGDQSPGADFELVDNVPSTSEIVVSYTLDDHRGGGRRFSATIPRAQLSEALNTWTDVRIERS